MITLYKIGASGTPQIWQIKRLSSDTIGITWGLLDGVMQSQVEQVTTNKSGRSLDEQVQSRIDSRVNLQLDKGYCSTLEEAKQSVGLNASKLLKPMLAKVYDSNKQYPLNNMWWQYKYDGHRCLVTRVGDKLYAYSRNGKPIETIGHILKGLVIPEGCTLDGELYIHGLPLQTISSIVRRVQPDNVKLKYIVYDVIQNVSFGKRLDFLHKLDLPVVHSHVATTTDSPPPEMLTNEGIIEEARAHGYEGFILRSPGKGYEPGKRSDQLLKVKMRIDFEARVYDIGSSADGWAVLHCTVAGRNFKVTAPGTMAEKTNILVNAADYIGKIVTVECAEWTNDGIPFHPVAIRFREEE